MSVITENLKKYNRRPTATVTAVQMNLDLALSKFKYFKWASWQSAKEGDWLVNNGGDVYTIDQDTFAQTYQMVSLGVYAKTGSVWAAEAPANGYISTKEGITHYVAGDMVVFNNADATDGYAMDGAKFDQLYQPLE